MTKKSIIIKQAQLLFPLQKKLYELKEKLLHLYAKTNDIVFLEAQANLLEFELTICKDFLAYSHSENASIDEFDECISLINYHLKKFCDVYNIT
jgi:hypothetical protein